MVRFADTVPLIYGNHLTSDTKNYHRRSLTHLSIQGKSFLQPISRLKERPGSKSTNQVSKRIPSYG